MTDFTSNFTFFIESANDSRYGDGLAFFIAPNGSSLNSTLGRGSSLGLPVDSQRNVSRSLYSFVAVEFDIFHNGGTAVDDPPSDHVGIDINSVKSIITLPWNGSVLEEKGNRARITYNSSTKVLRASYSTYDNSGIPDTKTIQHTVDLQQYLPEMVIVGFSASTGTQSALHKIKTWSFSSTLVHHRSSHKTGNGMINVRLVVGLSIGGCIIILVSGLGLIRFRFWKKEQAGESDGVEDPMEINDSIDEEFERATGPRKFSYSELAHATGNFKEGEKLGEGGFGEVYRGFIKDLNSYVAVKKISKRSKQGLKEYAAEVRIISRLGHRNLVKLIGWCHEKKLLLVYEFMPNGSLDSLLFKEKSLLAWKLRYKIAKGLAYALLYLHQEWEQCVLHRDIKSSNVMLDSNFNVKLGDFGLARLVDHGKQLQTTTVAGTRGYMAFEYVITGKPSKESDVYSFGMVALEIACGRKVIDHRFEGSQIIMVDWVWELYGEGKVLEAADPKLCGDFDGKEMECLLIVGLWCAYPDYTCRPSIQQAIQVLNGEAPLPILPSDMPVPKFPPAMSDSGSCSGGDKTDFHGTASSLKNSHSSRSLP
ncbi:hypothetical protein M0R45_000037 [Rubus argutus]|uniref:Protein kinase domain-containing protein n=1 Tax=Rubus argutus TaxID=59490 RepID=A0AAW1VS55_RUBAR